MDETTQPVANGTLVSYTGTITSHHGPCTVFGASKDRPYGNSRDGYRYTLVPLYGGGTLRLARRQSFAVVTLP